MCGKVGVKVCAEDVDIFPRESVSFFHGLSGQGGPGILQPKVDQNVDEPLSALQQLHVAIPNFVKCACVIFGCS